MKAAIEDWFNLYYLSDVQKDTDPCQRIAYTVVNKLVKAVFAEYSAIAGDGAYQNLVDVLDGYRKDALQLALVGGECYVKPCPAGAGFSFTLIPRNNVLIFGRNADGEPTDVGFAEISSRGQ